MTTPTPTAHGQLPVDATHAAALEAVRKIRTRTAACRQIVDRWQPAPCPDRKEYR